MAYQLKTTGIAANAIMAIAVDPDTNTIKDFASATVTTDMTIGGSITVGSQAWDGNTRKYFQLATSNYVAFGTNKPSFTFNTSNTQRTVVWIGEVAGSSARAFGNTASDYFASINPAAGGATYPHAKIGANDFGATSAALTSGNKAIFGWSLVRSGAADTSFVYSALHDASSGTVTTKTAGAWNIDYTIDYVGRRDDSTTQQNDKIHAVLIFNTALTTADLDALRDDWFGTLFEAVASGATVSATVGNAVAAGLTATILASVTIAGNVGNADAAGVTAAIQTGSANTISATVGNAAAAGLTAAILASATIAGNVGNATAAGLTATITSAGIGTLTTEPLKNNTGTLLASQTGVAAYVYNPTTGALVVSKTGQTTDASGIMTITDAAITPATQYRVVVVLGSGAEGLAKYTAS